MSEAIRHTGSASARSKGRRILAAALCAAVLAAACAPTGGPNDRATLEQVKRAVYGERADTEAGRIAAGVAQAVLEFTVEDSPPSIFVNWTVPDAQASAFASAIALPAGFSLAKVRILESDPEPRYWLSLNVYRVSGITTGLRAEWSTYVDDGSGIPRFMIVVARAADGSIDPIGPLAPPEPFSHSLGTNGVIATAMNKTVIQNGTPVVTPNNLYNSTIALPDPADRDYVVPAHEWVAANDFIYWLNGVNDRTFHNSSAHSASLISVDLADVALQNDSQWAPFLDPTPAHVLVYLGKIQFMIGPWWNVTEPDGRVNPTTRNELVELKKSMYSGLAQIQALSVRSGTAEPIVQSSAADSPPSVSWHWKVPIDKLADFTAAAGLPPGLSLAQTKLQDGDVDAAQWLTLNVRRESGLSTGLRAEWTTTVDDGSGVRTLIVESRADHPSLNPLSVPNVTYPNTPAYPVAHAIAGYAVSTMVGTGATSFASTFSVPAPGSATTVRASRQWVGAGDIRYWTNGIADRVFADSTVFDPKISIDPASVPVTNGGPWATFVGPSPDRVWVDQAGTDSVVNPWWNL